MIIDTKNQNLRTDIDTSNGGNYSIAATPHAFHILSSGVYEHKIAAVVREYMTNALDAHRMAGKEDVPFKVTAPTQLHPYFEVEDFGVGMDKEQALNTYTVYFFSDKNNSNDVTGGLGLGCKSALAYSTQFTIRVRKNGMEHTAMIYLDDDRCPRMDMISSLVTDMPNGVKITIPVRECDINEFWNEIGFYASFYPVRPDINIEDKLTYIMSPEEMNNDSPMISTSDHKSRSALAGHSVYALMGNVVYPIDLGSIGVSDKERSLIGAHKYGSYLFIKFDIGEVSVAASRESLSMDKRTTEAVKNKVRECIEYIDSQLQEITTSDLHPSAKYAKLVKLSNGSSLLGDYISKDRRLSDMTNILSLGKKFPSLRFMTRSWRSKVSLESIRSSLSRFVMDPDDNLVENITILVFDCDKKRVPGLISDQYSNGVRLASRCDISETRRRRMEAVFGVPVVLVKYSDLYKEYLASRRKAVSTAGRKTYPKTSIGGTVYEVSSDGAVFVNPDGRTEYEEGLTFYAENGEIEDRTNLRCSFELRAILAPDTCYKTYKIVKKDGKNAKRLEALKVPHLSTLFSDLVENHFDTLVSLFVANGVRWTRMDVTEQAIMEANSFNNNKEAVEAFKNLEHIVDRVSKIGEELEDLNASFYVSRVLIPGVREEADKICKDIAHWDEIMYNAVNMMLASNKYPMLRFLKQVDPSPADKQAIVEYIKFIDEKGE